MFKIGQLCRVKPLSESNNPPYTRMSDSFQDRIKVGTLVVILEVVFFAGLSFYRILFNEKEQGYISKEYLELV